MEKRVMSTPSKLQFATQQAAHWLSQNPTAVRVALFVAPVALALAVALATGTPVYACPAVSSGGGGCR
jgi:hypothetical protein